MDKVFVSVIYLQETAGETQLLLPAKDAQLCIALGIPTEINDP